MVSRTFSIIIPALNEGKLIGTCIRTITENGFTKEKYDILVMDNGSTDDTVSIARGCGAKVLICDRTKSIAAMRNKGAAATSGEVLAFIDADIEVPPNFLEVAAQHFDDHFRGALGFVDDVPQEAGWVGRVWGGVQMLKRPRVMAVDNLPGRNLLVNRSVFEEIGGFDEVLTTGEDKDFCMRIVKAGYKVISMPSPTPIHRGYEPDLITFIRKEFWRQGSALSLAQRHHYRLRSLRNPLLGLWHLVWGGAFIFGVFFSGRHGWMWFFSGFWIFPSIMIALKTVGRHRSRLFLFQYFILTFIRWNTTGLALVLDLYKRVRIRLAGSPAVTK